MLYWTAILMRGGEKYGNSSVVTVIGHPHVSLRLDDSAPPVNVNLNERRCHMSIRQIFETEGNLYTKEEFARQYGLCLNCIYASFDSDDRLDEHCTCLNYSQSSCNMVFVANHKECDNYFAGTPRRTYDVLYCKDCKHAGTVNADTGLFRCTQHHRLDWLTSTSLACKASYELGIGGAYYTTHFEWNDRELEAASERVIMTERTNDERNNMTEELTSCFNCGQIIEGDLNPIEVWWLGCQRVTVCDECIDEGRVLACERCYDRGASDEMYYIDDACYCESCYEVVGRVCDSCGEVYHCGHDGEQSSDGHNFCSTECAFNAGYCFCDNCNTLSDDIQYDEHSDHYYCEDCMPHGELYGYSHSDDVEFQCWGNGSATKPYIGIEHEFENPMTYSDRDRFVDMFYQNLPEDKFYVSSDCSLNTGAEVVSHPMTFEYMFENKYPETFIKLAVDNTMTSFCSSGSRNNCGIHFNISYADMGLRDFEVLASKMLVLCKRFEPEFKVLSGRCDKFEYANFGARDYNLEDFVSFNGKKANFDRLVDKIVANTTAHSSVVNFEHLDDGDESHIEFRLFGGTTNPALFYAKMAFTEAFVNLCREADWLFIYHCDWFSFEDELLHCGSHVMSEPLIGWLISKHEAAMQVARNRA